MSRFDPYADAMVAHQEAMNRGNSVAALPGPQDIQNFRPGQFLGAAGEVVEGMFWKVIAPFLTNFGAAWIAFWANDQFSHLSNTIGGRSYSSAEAQKIYRSRLLIILSGVLLIHNQLLWPQIADARTKGQNPLSNAAGWLGLVGGGLGALFAVAGVLGLTKGAGMAEGWKMLGGGVKKGAGVVWRGKRGSKKKKKSKSSSSSPPSSSSGGGSSPSSGSSSDFLDLAGE